MSFDWGAFVAGAADTTLKSWEKRDESDRKMQETKMLEQLRRDTSDYEFKRATEENKKQVKRNEFDPLTGESVGYNEYGQEIGGTRRKDQASIEAYNQNKQKFELDVANTKSEIAARTERNAIDRAELGLRRQALSQGGGSNTGGFGGGASTGTKSNPDPYDTANELIYRYKSEVEQAAKSGNISQAAIRAAAADLVENSKNGKELQEGFLRFLSNYQSGRKKTAQRSRMDAALAAKQGLDSL